MKITAYFDSPDSADHAAGALKRSLSALAAVETKNVRQKQPKNGIGGVNSFAVFNTLSGTSPTYSMPIYNAAYIGNDQRRDDDFIGTDYILEVTCRAEEYGKASRIIVGYGGRNISRT